MQFEYTAKNNKEFIKESKSVFVTGGSYKFAVFVAIFLFSNVYPSILQYIWYCNVITRKSKLIPIQHLKNYYYYE